MEFLQCFGYVAARTLTSIELPVLCLSSDQLAVSLNDLLDTSVKVLEPLEQIPGLDLSRGPLGTVVIDTKTI